MGRGIFALLLLLCVIAALRGANLLFDHSLHSIDGAMQTWFALDNFARGQQLGTQFQSYLGIAMPLALMPVFVAFGGTLFASTLSANIAVIFGAFVTAYAIAWWVRWIGPTQRWWAAILLVFVFYYIGNAIAQGIGLRFPATFDPGVSLRPLRGLLPFVVLPLFVILVRRIRARGSALPALALGLVGGVGLLWSNDAGIPLVIALTVALLLALPRRAGLMIRTLLAFGAGVIVSAAGLVLLVTHGDPAPWLQYNFRDVAGDQFWYFAPWDRATRILGPLDLPQILIGGELLSNISLCLLALCVVIVAIRRLRGRGAPVREAGFVMVGAAALGTALIPQIGGHIDGAYNNITFVLGLCAPLIVFQTPLLRLVRKVWHSLPPHLPLITAGLAATIMIAFEGGRLVVTANATDRVVRDSDLGFYVSADHARNLAAIRRLATHWDASGIAKNRQLLSVYTSTLDVAAGTGSPAPVGSLIHALGPQSRADYTALVARKQVAAVTTIHPDYSGWEGWMLRANWPFFRALFTNYRPIAATDQNVLWVRTGAELQPLGEAGCTISPVSNSALAITITAPLEGLASIEVERKGPFGMGRSALLTVTETSPRTAQTTREGWSDFPRYGVANQARLAFVAPVAAGAESRLLLDVMDGSEIGSAQCSAIVYPAIDYSALPGFSKGIDLYLAEDAR